MRYYDDDYPPYVPVAERRAKAEKKLQQMRGMIDPQTSHPTCAHESSDQPMNRIEYARVFDVQPGQMVKVVM
jgi:hypothetical protein